VFAGAFNYLDLEEFANVLKSAPWDTPEEVVLLVQDEGDEVMMPVYLRPQGLPHNQAAKDMQSVLDL
jgi:hypothetical protein